MACLAGPVVAAALVLKPYCRKIPGVTEVSVDLAARTMTLRFDGAVTNKERVVAAVETVVGSIP